MGAMKALSEARTAMVAVHGELDEAKLRLGIRTKLIYDVGDKMAHGAETTASIREVG
jgi:hypothetical protein